MNVPFGDLRREYQSLRPSIDAAIQRVLDRGWFVLGHDVECFEREFADYLQVRHVIGVASGTEAIQLALTAVGVRFGDEVITAANTCVPTVAGISATGAVPVLVDIDPILFTIDPALVEPAITPKTKAILLVHLYGQAADLELLLRIGRQYRIPVIEDSAQGHGASYGGRKLGTLADVGCFSFYPSKNLGAYGDGGAVVTNIDEIAAQVKRLRNYGQEHRDVYVTKGMNSRLDEVQAAILRAKLPHLDRWNARRREIAAFYNCQINNALIAKPTELAYGRHNYHLYVIRCERRDELQQHLKERGVATLVHYPVPVHLQFAYRDLNKGVGDFPLTEQCAKEVLSLPLFPHLTDTEARYITDCVNAFKLRSIP
jgi:dTDP-4-amino-4,6-dideoxygalactose transaminase